VYTLRSLARAVRYAADATRQYGLARALCEGLVEEASLLSALRGSARELAAGKRPGQVAYVVECQAQVVGVATVSEGDVDVASLKLHFALEDYVLFSEHAYDGHGRLDALVLNPIFTASTRFVLKELFRKARKSVLYLELRHSAPVPDVAREFVQVRPRRQIQLPPHLRAAAAAEAKARGGSDRVPDCALHFLTRKLISEPKIQNNVRIVVAGASDTSIAFLETLLTVPYLHFTSVTLLAPEGLPDGETGAAGGGTGAAGRGAGAGTTAPSSEDAAGSAPPAPDEPAVASDAFASSSLCYTARELRQLALGARVKVIRAHMADVDRVSKSIELAGSGERVPYDVLLLAPPLHDQTLAGLPEASRTVGGAFSLTGSEEVELDVSNYLRSTAWARREGLEDAAAFVYGGTLSAYTSLQALLARGVEPGRLCLVLPPDATSPFADPRVEKRARESLDRLGIVVLEDLRLRDLRAGVDGSISSIVLVDATGHHERELAASLLITADVPDVSDAIFRACNANSLVYDGRLVIDARFRTSDASIYAAGPLTKFSRRYRGGINLEHYDKRDVGVKVAHSLLPLLDPLSAGAAAAATDALPTFSQPRSEGGMLPGGLLYVHVQRPAKPTPHAELIKSGHIGRELTTVTDDVDYTCFRCEAACALLLRMRRALSAPSRAPRAVR
jgi:hypothetical protein